MKKIKIIFISALIILAICIFSLPSIFSSKIFKKFFTSENLTFEKASFSWFGPQKIYDLKIKSLEDQIINNKNIKEIFISSKELQINENFFSFIKKTYLNNTSLSFFKTVFQVKNLNIFISFKDNNLLKDFSMQDANGNIQLDKNFKNTYINLIGKTVFEKINGSFNININFLKDQKKANVNLKNFPTFFIDQFLDQKIEKFGPTMDLISTINIKNNIGDLNINFTSKNLKLITSLNYSNNTITLKEPLILYFSLQKNFLSKENNFYGIHSKTPMFLKIDPPNLKIKLPLTIKNINITKMYIDPAKIEASANEIFSSILSLSKKNLYSPKKITVWTAPFLAALQDGIFFISRADFLIQDSLHLACWGNIDFIKEKIKMTLGIPSSFLKTLSIQNLPPNYMMQIPIKGNFQKIKIDTKAFFLKITALKNRNILGPFSNLIPTITDDQSNIPKAKRPFPWE